MEQSDFEINLEGVRVGVGVENSCPMIRDGGGGGYSAYSGHTVRDRQLGSAITHQI